MKKLSVLFSMLFIAITLFAQITMVSTDMPTGGWSQRTAKDTLPLPAINFGSKGANQTYDFSSLVSVLNDTIYYTATNSTQQSTFNGADLAITADGVSFLYTKTTATVNDLRGLEGKFVPNGNVIQAAYSDPAELFMFPTTYNTNFIGTAYLQKDVPGSDVGQSFLYRVRLTTSTNFTDTIDGWGKVTTPLGSYKCLRKQRKETTNTLTEYKISQFSSWTTLSNTTATTVRYTYPTRETKGSVITFDYDSLNNVTGASWSLIPPAVPFADFGFNDGGNGTFTFTDSTDGYPDSYSWTFGDGGTSTSQNPSHTYTSTGTYNVCLTVTNAGGSNMHCDSVHVIITGISKAIEGQNDNVFIYPNPVTNNLTIQFHKTASDYRMLEIYNSAGQKAMMVNLTEVSEGIANIPVSELPAGVYTVSATDKQNNRKTLGRFTKE